MTSAPRWFFVCAALACLSVSAWAIHDMVRPKASWIVLEPLNGGALLLDQTSGVWCVVSTKSITEPVCHRGPTSANVQ
jgi:hypothetical protein